MYFLLKYLVLYNIEFKVKKLKNSMEFFSFFKLYIFLYIYYMIHIELGPSTIVGIGLIIIGILLYALRIREPNVSRGVIFMYLEK